MCSSRKYPYATRGRDLLDSSSGNSNKALFISLMFWALQSPSPPLLPCRHSLEIPTPTVEVCGLVWIPHPEIPIKLHPFLQVFGLTEPPPPPQHSHETTTSTIGVVWIPPLKIPIKFICFFIFWSLQSLCRHHCVSLCWCFSNHCVST